jgi:hypothetical protein
MKEESTDLVRHAFPESAYNQLSKIKSHLSETDNPILLIGKPREEILIFK